MLEMKDFLLLLLGIAGGVVGNYIYKSFEQSKDTVKELIAKLSSKNKDEKRGAASFCLVNAGKWYIIANIFWVVSGAAWVFEGPDRVDAIKLVLGCSSAISIFFFWVSLRWVARGIIGFKN